MIQEQKDGSPKPVKGETILSKGWGSPHSKTAKSEPVSSRKQRGMKKHHMREQRVGSPGV